MPFAQFDTFRLCYETEGPADGDPLILIEGLGGQLVGWHGGFVDALIDAGFRVTRFDNRDAGLSSKFEDDPEYSIVDMAADVAGLIDRLGLESAHVAGQSMGGMIGQQVAISFPTKMRSFCSICSCPHNGFVTQDEEIWEQRKQPPAPDREGRIRQWIEQERISGLDWLDNAEMFERGAMLYDRSFYPDGVARQEEAFRRSLDRSDDLAGVDLPTVVIHGRSDRLIDFRGGIATAEAIQGAELHVFAGMQHQMAPRYWEDVVRAIRRNANRAMESG